MLSPTEGHRHGGERLLHPVSTSTEAQGHHHHPRRNLTHPTPHGLETMSNGKIIMRGAVHDQQALQRVAVDRAEAKAASMDGDSLKGAMDEG